MTPSLPARTVPTLAPRAPAPAAGARFQPPLPGPRPGAGGVPAAPGRPTAQPAHGSACGAARAAERDAGSTAAGRSGPPWRLAAWVAAADLPRVAAALGPRVVVVPCATVGALEAALAAGDCRAAVVAAAVVPAPDAPRLATLVRGHPDVLTAGMVGEAEGWAARSRLRGAGVLALCDADRAVGWHALGRSLAPAHLDDPLQRRGVAAVASAVWGAHRFHGLAAPGLADFFAAVFAPEVADAHDVAARLGVPAPVLDARFSRRGLPGVRRYVETAHLVRAAHLAAAPEATVRAVAAALGPGAPQRLHHAVRRLTGVSAGEFCRRASARAPKQAPLDQVLLEHFRAALVRPYRDALNAFDPTHREVARDA